MVVVTKERVYYDVEFLRYLEGGCYIITDTEKKEIKYGDLEFVLERKSYLPPVTYPRPEPTRIEHYTGYSHNTEEK